MPEKNLAAWLEFIQQQHPREIELGLDRVREVHGRLGLRTDAGKAIAIAGTNGKGSCAAWLEAVYMAAGTTTGVYTSPHLQNYNERIRVNGAAVSDEQIIAAFERIESLRGDISLTYFEYGTLAALQIFNQQNVDLCVLEVGMGGRLDAVNVIDAEVAIVTSIGLDHQSWLGDNREAIAREKAGIFRAGRPAIVGDPEAPLSLQSHADATDARLIQINTDFHYQKTGRNWAWQGQTSQHPDLPLPQFGGDEQLQNASVALAAVEQMQFFFRVSRSDITAALSRVSLPGRFQKIQKRCLWILDVAHNAAAAKALARSLQQFPGRTIAVIGLMQDKPIASIAHELAPMVDEWITVSDHQPRSAGAEQLAQDLSKQVSSQVRSAITVRDGLELADSEAGENDRIVVTGSFHVVGPALDYLAQHSGAATS